jgi:hypothetical protein
MSRVVAEIVEHMLEKELKTSKSNWLRDLKEKGNLARGTAKKVLDGKDGISPGTKKKLAAWFRTIPTWEKIDESWFDVASLAEFLDRREQSKREAKTRLELEVPQYHDHLAVTKGIIGTFVAYRYAFEAVGSEVAREVVTFTQSGDRLVFEMSYRLSHDKTDQPVLLFEGTAGVIGRSVIGIAASTTQHGPVRQEEVTRARSLFFAHAVDPTVDNFAKFGILTSTRMGGHQPCAACILMFRVSGDVRDLASYRDKATVIRPIGEFLETDFKQFSPDIHSWFEQLLSNTPRDDIDTVLRLHHDRFTRIVAQILKQSKQIKDLRAPWTPAWIKALPPRAPVSEPTDGVNRTS